MAAVDLEAYVTRCRAADLAAFPWADVPRHPVPPEAIRTLRYMQDVDCFSADDGRAAARKIDATIGRLPRFSTVRLVETWIDSFAGIRPRPLPAADGAGGGRNGHPDG